MSAGQITTGLVRILIDYFGVLGAGCKATCREQCQDATKETGQSPVGTAVPFRNSDFSAKHRTNECMGNIGGNPNHICEIRDLIPPQK